MLTAGSGKFRAAFVVILLLDVSVILPWPATSAHAETLFRPNPDREVGLGNGVDSVARSCSTIADCSGLGVPPNVDCIVQGDGTFPGTCYVSASRYLSIAPSSGNFGSTARRISLDINGNDTFDPGVDHVLGWVGEPFATNVTGPEPSPQAQARISATSVYRNWNDLTDIDPTFEVGGWGCLVNFCAGLGGVPCESDLDCPQGEPVRLGGCEIAPGGAAPNSTGNTYFIQSFNPGHDENDEAWYSAPLRLRTTTRYADVAGWGPDSIYPSQSVSLLDAFAIISGFQGAQSIPKWRLEQSGGQVFPAPNIPSFDSVNLLDVFDAIGAFQSGGAYPYHQPCDCPGQDCP